MRCQGRLSEAGRAFREGLDGSWGCWPVHRRCPQFPQIPPSGSTTPIPAPTYLCESLTTRVLWVPPHPHNPSPTQPQQSPPHPDARIGSGCPSPRPSASWLPCCSLQSPGASRWPAGFPRVTLSYSGSGKEIQCKYFMHTVTAKHGDSGGYWKCPSCPQVVAASVPHQESLRKSPDYVPRREAPAAPQSHCYATLSN